MHSTGSKTSYDGKGRGKKATYEKPVLVRIGSFESVTQHASSGWALDNGFPSGAPASTLTFSDPPPR